ncbi:MAG: hypothetical protein JWL64_927, partial [Frankiales bacterium]|nr:hypothetical protein [Frankiales bacterium]
MPSQLPWKAGEHASRTVRSPRAMFLVALVGAGVAVPFITSGASAAGTAGPTQSVLVSAYKDRSAAVSLADRNLTGNAY